MKFLDLTQPIYQGMPVFPGDPQVRIEQLQTLEQDGWNMQRLHMNTHDGTHVNVPLHATHVGKTLDDYSVDDFCGQAVRYEDEEDLQEGKGIIFVDQSPTLALAKRIVEMNVKFIGISKSFETAQELAVEKYLLEQGIISFEKLTNTKNLPKTFFFHGAPLKIKKGDGSPVRAYAVIS